MATSDSEKRSREKRLVVIAGALLFLSWMIAVAVVISERGDSALLIAPLALILGNVLIWRSTHSPTTCRLAQVSTGLVIVVFLLPLMPAACIPPYGFSLRGLAAGCAQGISAPAAGLLSLVALALRIREFYGPDEKPGLCAKCGYSLTGLRDPRCPECDTPFNPALLQRDQSNGGTTSPPSQNAGQ